MANRAVLLVVEGERERTLRMADYLVPLFWLACLAPEDELNRKQLDDNDPDDYVLHVDISPASALARFRSRTDALEALLEQVPGDHEACRVAWVQFLSGAGGTLRFDVTEILSMVDGGEEEFRRATSYFENPSPVSAASIIAITSMNDVVAG